MTHETPVSSLTTEWLTAHEAAAYLKVEPRTVLKWARAGKIKGYRLSGTDRICWRFRRADLDETMMPPSVAEPGGFNATEQK